MIEKLMIIIKKLIIKVKSIIIEDSCLYIGNIDKKVTEDKLKDIFAKYGELDYCYIVYEP